MSAFDRRNFLRTALGVVAAAACGLPVTGPAEAATLPMLKPAPLDATAPLVEPVARRRRRGRRGRIVVRGPRGRIVIRTGPPRRRRRRCWINRRGRRVCVIRR